MAGRVKELIDQLVKLRTEGNPGLGYFVRAHLMLNGIDPEHHTETTEDDPQAIEALQQMIRNFRRK